jgi:hypothetical protein
MFVTVVTDLAVPAAVAQHRLLTVLHTERGLRDAAAAAYETGQAVLLRAGFAGISKQVAVHIVPAYLRGATTVIPLRWVATGPAGDLFPAMDANLELDPTADGQCRLTLLGNYQPPLGHLGAGLDRVLLHRAARSTARGLLTRVGRVILATQPAPDAGPGYPAAHDDGRVDPRWPGPLPLPPPAGPAPAG